MSIDHQYIIIIITMIQELLTVALLLLLLPALLSLYFFDLMPLKLPWLLLLLLLRLCNDADVVSDAAAVARTPPWTSLPPSI